MTKELINLLPPERASTHEGYFLRLAVVALVLLSGVLVVHGVLLLPSYLYLNQEVQGREAQLDALTASLSGAEEGQVTARVSTLDANATYLARLADAPTASGVVRAILAVARPGVSLTGFTYTEPSASEPGRLGITGIAATREALRTYDEALSKLPFVTNVDLPISAYAKESNIDFSITLTGSLTP